MANLNDQQLANLLDALGSSMASDNPIPTALKQLSSHRGGRLSQVATKLLQRIERGESLEAAVSEVGLPHGEQVIAAIRGSQKSGTSEMLYETAETLRSRHDLKTTIRLNWFYPCVLTVVAYTMFVISLAPTIRQNEELIRRWPDYVTESAHWVQYNWWIPPCVAVVVLCIVILTLRKRRQLPAVQRRSLFCSTLASQLRADVPESEAIRIAAMMAGEKSLANGEEITLNTPRVKALTDIDWNDVLFQHETPDDRGQDLSAAPSLARALQNASLKHAAYRYENAARRRELLLHRILPQTAGFIFGFVFTVGMAFLFIAPIFGTMFGW